MGSFMDVWRTYKLIWLEATTVFLVYLCTMICYPGLILQTNLSFIENESWFQVLMLSNFSLAEIMGRFMATYLIPVKDLTKYSYIVLGWAGVRLLLIYTSL
jgi:hypothetical protein